MVACLLLPAAPLHSRPLGMFTEKTNKHLAGCEARILFHPDRQPLAEQLWGPATTLNTLSDGTTNSLVFGRGNGKQGWSLIRAKQKFIAERREQSGTWDLRIGLCQQAQTQLQSPLGRILKCGKSDYNWSVISAVMETATLCVLTSYTSLCLLSNIPLYNGIVNQA